MTIDASLGLSTLGDGITTRIEVDLNIIRENFLLIREYVKPASVCAVLKGNAYGHGAVYVAETLEQAGCLRCAVATLDEALELKSHGTSMDIQVLGALSAGQMRIALKERLIPFVPSLELLSVAREVSESLEETRRAHIKIDTGLGRFGFLPSEIPSLVSSVKHLSHLKLEGIATHLARATDDDVFTRRQLELFDKTASLLENALGYHLMRHSLATMGVLLYKDFVPSDMVRVGSLLYGLAHIPIPAEIRVRPALTIRTELVQVKSIPSGWNLGYGHVVADRAMKIGLIPAGIVDGFMSSSAFKAHVLVQGVRCRLLGVSADSAIVDLSLVPGGKSGDEVVIVGSQGDQVSSVRDLGVASGTNYSEILMKVMPRVARVVKYPTGDVAVLRKDK